MKRVAVRRKPRKDPVTSEVREAVMQRDGCCFLSRIYSSHECRDRWGYPHASTDLHLLTLDHVHDGYGLTGKRAPSDPAHLVAMCWAGNVGVPSKEVRQAERAYLASAAGWTEPELREAWGR